MEQAREGRGLVQAEARVEPVAVAAVLVAVRRQVLADTVFAQTVVKKCHTNWEPHATSKNALNAGPP